MEGHLYVFNSNIHNANVIIIKDALPEKEAGIFLEVIGRLNCIVNTTDTSKNVWYSQIKPHQLSNYNI